MYTKEEFAKDWKHFCSHINFGDSAMDAESIRIMNEMPAKIGKVLDAAPDLLAACKDTLKQAGISTNSPTYKKLEQAITKAGV